MNFTGGVEKLLGMGGEMHVPQQLYESFVELPAGPKLNSGGVSSSGRSNSSLLRFRSKVSMTAL